MGRMYVSKYALCPYYRREDRNRLLCEGVEEGTANHLVFDGPLHKQQYRQYFCCDNYRDCRIGRMLDEKYGMRRNERGATCGRAACSK